MKLKLDANKKYAVALEGGGAKGAYQIGAWRALREAGIQFSAVAGTSVGALNGALMVMDDLPKAEKIWSEIRYSKVMDVDDETMKKLRSLDFKDFAACAAKAEYHGPLMMEYAMSKVAFGMHALRDAYGAQGYTLHELKLSE